MNSKGIEIILEIIYKALTLNQSIFLGEGVVENLRILFIAFFSIPFSSFFSFRRCIN